MEGGMMTEAENGELTWNIRQCIGIHLLFLCWYLSSSCQHHYQLPTWCVGGEENLDAGRILEHPLVLGETWDHRHEIGSNQAFGLSHLVVSVMTKVQQLNYWHKVYLIPPWTHQHSHMHGKVPLRYPYRGKESVQFHLLRCTYRYFETGRATMLL